MASPHTLIFVDFPSDDVEACAAFYRDVFGWEVGGTSRPASSTARSRRLLPAPRRLDSPIGNLHLGFYDARNARPHPDPAGVEPRHLSRDGPTLRVWILLGDDETEDEVLRRAEKHGATGALAPPLLEGVQRASTGRSKDPWGNTVVLWGKGGDDPIIPEDYTRE
jgi:catechol 2,3-dioxygenase-like lactoylglutathione lyase family enzyme